jgi:hypothetical protein
VHFSKNRTASLFFLLFPRKKPNIFAETYNPIKQRFQSGGSYPEFCADWCIATNMNGNAL